MTSRHWLLTSLAALRIWVSIPWQHERNAIVVAVVWPFLSLALAGKSPFYAATPLTAAIVHCQYLRNRCPFCCVAAPYVIGMRASAFCFAVPEARRALPLGGLFRGPGGLGARRGPSGESWAGFYYLQLNFVELCSEPDRHDCRVPQGGAMRPAKGSRIRRALILDFR